FIYFLKTVTAEELWRGVMAETGAGARKGRGKRTKRKMKKDLNRGQTVGEGRGGFLWPGLNIPIVKSGTIQAISKRDQAQQEDLQAEIIRQRDEWDRRRRMKVKRERGWTGNSWGGISLGPPDSGPNGETYEDFDSRVIEVKSVFNMTAKEGRKRSISALVAVGNGNGAAGFALGKAADRTTALRKETHQNLAENKQLHVVEFQNVCGPLPIIVASPRRGAREDPEPEDEIPDTKLDWDDVKAAQGMKRSVWADVKRTIW
ncbi:28S ribosomal protein S5, mitochondrial, partial [Acipenser ruthenus]